MRLRDVVQELLQCLGNEGDVTVAWEETRRWPKGAIDSLQKTGWLEPADLAETVECSGCDENCSMPVQVFPPADGQPMRAFVACEDRNFGRVKIAPSRLQQWRLTQGQLARWVGTELGFQSKPEEDGVNRAFKLGRVRGNSRVGLVDLTTADPVSIQVSGHSLPLIDVLSVKNGHPDIDRKAIRKLVDLPPVSTIKPGHNAEKRPTQRKSTDIATRLEIGSPEWRQQTARNAANARHDQPGGSRDKQQQIRKIWATGKYSSRDLCAEEEYAALGMSFSAARKALRNTPDPS